MTTLLQYIHAHSDACSNGCRVWTAATRDSRSPVMRWQGKVQSVRRVLLEWAGVDLTGLVASTSCDTPLCVARRHVVAKTRKEAQQRVVGQPVSLLRRLRLSKANARNYRYTDEQVRLARTMPGTQREVAAVLGIPQSTVSKYRRSITRRMGDPMAQLLMVGGVR